MNMMPQPGMMAPAMPPMPSPEEIEKAQAILDAISWEEMEPILRTDERRNYNIDIETDSTAFQDEEAEKASRIECVSAMTAMLEKAVPAIQLNPKLAPLIKELGMFALGAFKIGRTLEETFEETFDQLSNVQPQPNPEEAKMAAEAKMQQEEFALKQEGQKQDLAFKQQDHQLKLQGQQADIAFKTKELEMKAQEAEINRQAQAEDRAFQRDQQMADRQQKAEEFAFNRDAKAMEMRFANEDRQFQRGLAEGEFVGKAQEREAKLGEGRERLAMDQSEQQARRALEADQLKGPDGKTPRDAIVSQVQNLVEQVGEAVGKLSEQQILIVQALQGIAGEQQETNEALTAVVRRMTAPKKLVRGNDGRASGIEIGENEGDLSALLGKLAQGGQFQRGKDNRIEAFA